VTDPDKRNITDQRYADDAATRYQAASTRPRPHAQWLDYFSKHYGDTHTAASGTLRRYPASMTSSAAGRPPNCLTS